MPPSAANDLFAFLTELMTQHASLFQSMGYNMFRGFAVIREFSASVRDAS